MSGRAVMWGCGRQDAWRLCRVWEGEKRQNGLPSAQRWLLADPPLPPTPPRPGCRRTSYSASTGGSTGKTTSYATHCALNAPADPTKCSGCRLQVEVSRADLRVPLSLVLGGGVSFHHDPVSPFMKESSLWLRRRVVGGLRRGAGSSELGTSLVAYRNRHCALLLLSRRPSRPRTTATAGRTTFAGAPPAGSFSERPAWGGWLAGVPGALRAACAAAACGLAPALPLACPLLTHPHPPPATLPGMLWTII